MKLSELVDTTLKHTGKPYWSYLIKNAESNSINNVIIDFKIIEGDFDNKDSIAKVLFFKYLKHQNLYDNIYKDNVSLEQSEIRVQEFIKLIDKMSVFL